MVPLFENQFQMLNVTNRSWKFGVDGREGIEGLPLRNEPCFSSGFILFPSSLRHWSLLLILKLDWRMNAAYYIKYQKLFSCRLLTIMFGVCSRLVIKLQGCESNTPFFVNRGLFEIRQHIRGFVSITVLSSLISLLKKLSKKSILTS